MIKKFEEHADTVPLPSQRPKHFKRAGEGQGKIEARAAAHTRLRIEDRWALAVGLLVFWSYECGTFIV